MNTDIFRKAVVPVSAGVAGLSVGGVLGFLVGQRRERRRRIHLIRTAQAAIDDFTGGMELDGHTKVGDLPVGDLRAPVFERPHDIEKDGRIPYYQMHPGIRELVENIKSTDVEMDGDDKTPDEIDDMIDEDRAAVDEAVTRQNAFANPYDVADDNWDWERELNERSNKPIYVITTEEFQKGEMGFRQSSFVFYEGDRMMTDENGDPVYNWTSQVGTELPFGHGTGDEDLVFIRNESLKWEYEIQRDPGKHSVDVEGHDIQLAYEENDIKHSHQPLKMRRE